MTRWLTLPLHFWMGFLFPRRPDHFFEVNEMVDIASMIKTAKSADIIQIKKFYTIHKNTVNK